MPGSWPKLGCVGRVGGTLDLFGVVMDGSKVAASLKFLENGIGARGADIKLAGLLAYVPAGIWAYLPDPCFLYRAVSPRNIEQ